MSLRRRAIRLPTREEALRLMRLADERDRAEAHAEYLADGGTCDRGPCAYNLGHSGRCGS